MAAPNVPMADRRLNIPVHCATSERFMIVSIGCADQRELVPRFCKFNSAAIELSMS